ARSRRWFRETISARPQARHPPCACAATTAWVCPFQGSRCAAPQAARSLAVSAEAAFSGQRRSWWVSVVILRRLLSYQPQRLAQSHPRPHALIGPDRARLARGLTLDKLTQIFYGN